ncbi:sigma-70 family RNA polymerase sigma factor [Hyalangium versicolor]|uniref:sigma-70 family RNA polymerase sigma factor n=1 Tax=Hyalangium versicolor TaxID=2861190 RepID=UPI001CCE7E81|nr:sigma-70 family RNA polymerase sigma factor [Hyalangium versicolor]
MKGDGASDRSLRERAGLKGGEELETLLSQALEAGRAAWPGISLEADAFLRHIARHVPNGGSPEEHLRELRAAELYLACACAAQVPAALTAFQERFSIEVDQALRKRKDTPLQPDELRQVLWEKLFVGRPGAQPKIADYSGRGPLGAWVRVAAVRTSLNLREQGAREVLVEVERPVFSNIPTPDPELAFLKSRYRAEFKEALETAMAELPSDQRNVLRLHFLDGLSIDRIGAVYGVHRATAARWVQKGREALLEGTCRLLSERLQVTPPELESILDMVRSQLDVSLGGLMRESKP